MSFIGQCVDGALQNVRNLTIMKNAGWIDNGIVFPIHHSYACRGYETFWGFHKTNLKTKNPDIGYVKASFKGSGTGTLNFGNCYDKYGGKVTVYLNNQSIAEADLMHTSEDVRFKYKKGDVLKIAEERAIMKINSLKLDGCEEKGN